MHREDFVKTFTVQIDQYVTKGPAVFPLTHFRLLGEKGPVPFTVQEHEYSYVLR